MNRLSTLATQRPKRVIAVAAAFFVVAGVFGAPIAGKLHANTRDFQDPSSESIAAVDTIKRAMGHDDKLGIVALVRTPGAFPADPSARGKVHRVAQLMAADPDIVRVVDPTRAPTRGLVSRDHHQVLVGAAFGPGGGDAERAAVARLRAKLDGHNVRFGGRDVVFDEISERVSHDLGRAELLVFPLLFLLSLLVFRGAIAALLPPLVGGLSIVTTFLALRFVNDHVTTLSIFALNLVTGVGLGLAIDYSLFMVSRWREEIARSGPGAEAMRRTLATAGRTVLFSALTVAAAIASMLLFPLKFLYSMGIGGAIVALIAAAVSLTVLPAVLFLLGDRINSLSPKRLRRAAQDAARPAESGGWYRLAHAVMRRPGVVALTAGGALLLIGLPFLRITFLPADAHMLPVSSEARQVTDALSRDFNAAATQPIRVVVTAPHASRRELTAYAATLRGLPGAGRVGPPRPLGASTWEISIVSPGDPLAKANRMFVHRIRDVPATFDVKVGGDAAAFADQQSSLSAHLPLALIVLSLTTFAILFLMTGSVILPIKALIMNALTVSAAFGIIVLVFQDGRLEGLLDYKSAGGMEATQPVLLFAIVFGLATDYGVFLLSRIKEARDAGMGERESVAFGLERTGRIVTAAAVLFCVAIGAFSTSNVLFIKQLGLGTALAVAIDATIVRALLVPALMAMLGKWNWWAPGPLRRLHRRVGISEGAPA